MCIAGTSSEIVTDDVYVRIEVYVHVWPVGLCDCLVALRYMYMYMYAESRW